MTLPLAPLRMFCTLLALVLTIVSVSPISLSAAEISPPDQAKLNKYGQHGGPFSLIDQTGKAVRDSDFKGKYMLVFFGYTFCPDICPTAMQTVSDSLDLLGDVGQDIQPIFITLDPERDTSKVLADFTSNFSPRIIALTGDRQAINALAKDYGVKFERDETAVQSGDPYYLINHSVATYVMNREGRFLVFFPAGVSAQDMARNLRKIVKNY